MNAREEHAGTASRWSKARDYFALTKPKVVSLILYGSAMSNSNVHDHAPLPVLVAGGAGGKLKGGRHLSYPTGTPMSNLLVSILNKAGVEQERVGDSTGLLSDL
jgi:hypothetical protein